MYVCNKIRLKVVAGKIYIVSFRSLVCLLSCRFPLYLNFWPKDIINLCRLLSELSCSDECYSQYSL